MVLLNPRAFYQDMNAAQASWSIGRTSSNARVSCIVILVEFESLPAMGLGGFEIVAIHCFLSRTNLLLHLFCRHSLI